MINSDTDHCFIFPAYIYQREQLCVNPLKFLVVFLFSELLFFKRCSFVCIVTGIDPDLFNKPCGGLGSNRIKVNIGNQRSVKTGFSQFFLYYGQVFCLPDTLCGQSHIISSGLNNPYALGNRFSGVEGICVGHRLETDRVGATERDGADMNH